MDEDLFVYSHAHKNDVASFINPGFFRTVLFFHQSPIVDFSSFFLPWGFNTIHPLLFTVSSPVRTYCIAFQTKVRNRWSRLTPNAKGGQGGEVTFLGGGNSNIFGIFTPVWGRWTQFWFILFQMGWKHQLACFLVSEIHLWVSPRWRVDGRCNFQKIFRFQALVRTGGCNYSRFEKAKPSKFNRW